MENETIEIVDHRGKLIKRARRSTAYTQGLLHKAVNIIIYNDKGEIFLQMRSSNKSSFPLHWDISCSEHLQPNESYKKAAIRGLREELKIETKIKRIRQQHHQRSEFYKNKQKIIENELVELYSGIWTGKIKLNKDEVKKGTFLSLTNVREKIKLGKMTFTPWAKDELNFLIENQKN